MNGALVIDKPPGPSSHDVVAAVRRATGLRRIGHTGTLDPMATGVLVLALGRATRLVQFLTAHDKVYEATIRLGIVTDTYDITGTPVGTPHEGSALDRELIARTLDDFRGAHDQMPPPYSAKKVGGVRAYTKARRHQPVALRSVRVTAHDLELLEIDGSRIRIRLACSAGFYVRSLAHDFGQRLGVGACLEALRRVRVGRLTIEDAVSLDQVCAEGADVRGRVVPMERLVADLAGVTLTPLGAQRAAHGNTLGPEHLHQELAGEPRTEAVVRLLDPAGALIGLARPGPEPGILRPAVVLV